jgi:hypothetical protein
MTSEELQTQARRQPFEPFRVILTTGATYDIRHPDLIMIGRRSAIIGVTKRPQRTVYDVTIQVDLLHVVGIESIPDAPSAANGPTG